MSSRPNQSLAGAFAGFILGFLGGTAVSAELGGSVRSVWITALSAATASAVVCALVGWFVNVKLGHKVTYCAVGTVVSGGIAIVVISHMQAGTFQRMAYHQRGREFVVGLNDMLHQDARFAGVTAKYHPVKSGIISLRGCVSSQTDLDGLTDFIRAHDPPEHLLLIDENEIYIAPPAER
jgi:hypothetical protein